MQITIFEDDIKPRTISRHDYDTFSVLRAKLTKGDLGVHLQHDAHSVEVLDGLIRETTALREIIIQKLEAENVEVPA